MSARLVTECSVCGNPNLKMVLSLGSSPPTCVMEKVDQPQASSTHYPLDLMFCEDCTLAQLSVVVDPEVVFPVDYPYSSGNSRALHENFEDLAQQASLYMGPEDLVVDIGANDGTLLGKFPSSKSGARIGVEPTTQGVKIQGEWYQDFFDLDLAADIRKAHGPAKVITACNVLAHVDDISDVMSGIHLLLADDGVLIAENHDLASVVDGQWDTIYHEHLRFFNPHSFAWLLRKHEMGAKHWQIIPTHGGSFRMVATKNAHEWSQLAIRPEYDFDALLFSAQSSRDALRRNLGGGAWGIGATARATTIINYCGLDVEDITCVAEVSGSDKIGRLIPGTRIPVVDEARLFEVQPYEVVLFSWHMADVIIPRLREKGYEGDIIIPLPQVQYADA